MDRLPSHILDEVLLKLDDPKSLAMMQCTNRYLRWHISSNDMYFKSKYIPRDNSRLFYVSTFGSNTIFWHSSRESWSSSNWDDPLHPNIFGSCSGLVLLFIRGLSVMNPLVQKSRQFLKHSESKFLSDILISKGDKHFKLYERSVLGFAVDRTTQRFKMVCLSEKTEYSNPVKTMYRFEISSGEDNSGWKLSDTTITCNSSNVMLYNKPVYLHGGYVHWLRHDGSIIAFNPVTEKVRLIPINFPPGKRRSRIMFTTTDQQVLTLITAPKKETSFYALDSILNDPKWILVKRIVNREMMTNWNIAGYDGRWLVVKEKKKDKEEERYNGSIFHVYDLSDTKKSPYLPPVNVILKPVCGLSKGDVHALRSGPWF